MHKGRPDTHKLKIGQVCKQPLKDQIFPDEWPALDYFKKHCDTCKHYSDEFLFATLFARKMDIDRAIELLEHNWKWRIANGHEVVPSVDEIDWEFVQANLCVPGARTKDGLGIVFAFFAKQDPSALDIEKVLKWCCWFYTEGMFHNGMDVARNGIFMVSDMEGLGWKHFDMKFQKRMMEIYQDNFPTRMKKSIQVNPPSFIKVIWTLARPFIKKKMMDRFFVGSVAEIQDYIAKDQLWSPYGGDIEFKHEDWVEQIKDYGRWFRNRTYEEEKNGNGEKKKKEKKESKIVEGSSKPKTKKSAKPKTDNYDI
jgi:hypothetical protein